MNPEPPQRPFAPWSKNGKSLVKYVERPKKLKFVSLFSGLSCFLLSAILYVSLFNEFIQTSSKLFIGAAVMSGFFFFGGIMYTFQSFVVKDMLECLDSNKLERKIYPESDSRGTHVP